MTMRLQRAESPAIAAPRRYRVSNSRITGRRASGQGKYCRLRHSVWTLRSVFTAKPTDHNAPHALHAEFADFCQIVSKCNAWHIQEIWSPATAFDVTPSSI
jgi:hypothetical protein